MNKLDALEANILVTSELSASVKELIAQEHHDAAALLTNKLCLYVEKSQKMLQEYREEIAIQPVVLQVEVDVNSVDQGNGLKVMNENQAAINLHTERALQVEQPE